MMGTQMSHSISIQVKSVLEDASCDCFCLHGTLLVRSTMALAIAITTLARTSVATATTIATKIAAKIAATKAAFIGSDNGIARSAWEWVLNGA